MARLKLLSRRSVVCFIALLSLILAVDGLNNEIDAFPSQPPHTDESPESIAVPHHVEVPQEVVPSVHVPTMAPCVPCLAGNFSGANCTGCAPGSCSATDLCSPCPLGHDAPGNGTVKCGVCEPGQFAPEPGLAQCPPCPITFYCPQTTDGAHEPTPCPPGSRCPTRGMSLPVSCSAGFYCPSQRMIIQLQCPEGYYCPQIRTVNPTICPDNHFCVAGAIVAEPCAALYKSKMGAPKCSPAPSFFIIIFGTIVLVLSIAGGIFIFRNRWMVDTGENRISTRRTQPPTDRTKLMMDSEDDGGYHGT